MKLEGVVSKRAEGRYRSGRTDVWIKVKCWNHDRFVVVGFVPDGAGGLAKLRLARREGRALVYAGRVGNGMGPQDCSHGSGSTRAAGAAHVASLQAG
jgi:bifunctional non-homologous end joining protein LigD